MGRLRVDRLAGPPAPLRRGDGSVLAARCHRAGSPLARTLGLLLTPDMRRDEALWLPRCGSVHSLGLRAPIGCALLDAGGRVIRVVDPLPRGRVVAAAGARAVVECRAGVLAEVRVGEVLSRDEIPAPSERGVTGGG